MTPNSYLPYDKSLKGNGRRCMKFLINETVEKDLLVEERNMCSRRINYCWINICFIFYWGRYIANFYTRVQTDYYHLGLSLSLDF